MPKVKMHSGAKKRFRLTGTGKVKRHHAFKRHCLSKRKKSIKQKRYLTCSGLVHKSNMPVVCKLLNA